ncbi:MAG: hypothetical protein HY059_09725 [Proteobacteria bacterium]|nr:hypothetical protein [Pseudomonadota bacterium]
MKRLAGVLACSLLAARPASASHEDFGAFGQGAGMGEAMVAAAQGVNALPYNPAGLAGVRTLEFGMGYKRGFIHSAGVADVEQTSLGVASPIDLSPVHGALGVFWQYEPRRDVSLDRTLGLSYATKGFREYDEGILDFGATLKSLSRSGRLAGGSNSKAGVDVGAAFRMREDRTIALSFLNINGPRMDVGAIPDRAPVIMKAGYSQLVHGFTWAFEFTKREPSLGFKATNSVGSGLEYWINTPHSGSFAARTGLNLGDPGRFLSLGAGWRILGAEVDYALQAPLGQGSRYDNTLSLIYRFGRWNPEREYEKMLGNEIRHRQDLTRALDRSEEKQKQLGEEMRRLQGDIAALRRELANKSASEAQAKERLQRFEERERRAKEAYEELERRKRELANRTKESLWREDWGKFLKLKDSGAPDLVLMERVKQLLLEYRSTGVDLSDANLELQRLQRNTP